MPLRFEVQGREYPYPDITSVTVEESDQIRDLINVSMIGVIQKSIEKVYDEDVLKSSFVLAKLRAGEEPNLDALKKVQIVDLIPRFVDDEPEETDVPLPGQNGHGEDAPPKPRKPRSAATSKTS
jgi:hypothetical protein